jgi:hypothetical protein
MIRLRCMISIVASLLAFLLTTSPGQAQLSMSSLGTPAVITFEDTLPGVGFGAWAGGGFAPGTAVAGQLDSNAWAMTGWSDGNLVFGGTQTTVATDYTRGTSAVTVSTTGVYSLTHSTIGSRSLGFQPDGVDFTPGTVTLRAVNNTGTTVTSIDVSYDLFVRNDQSRSTTFNAAFSVDDVSYSSLPSLNYTSTEAAEFNLGFILNQRSTTITGLSIPNGQSFYFRWLTDDFSGTGGRDEFALDNIALTPVPEPATILALAALSVGLGRIGRRNVTSIR